jgi:hypothetical protein
MRAALAQRRDDLWHGGVGEARQNDGLVTWSGTVQATGDLAVRGLPKKG